MRFIFFLGSRKIFLFISFVLCYNFSYCQEKRLDISAHSDCLTPYKMGVDSVLMLTIAPPGFGKKLEIRGRAPKDLYSFTREHHTVWYEFEAAHSGLLTFDLVPEKIHDDYDFLLFRGAATDTLCAQIETGSVRPIRTNISRFNPAIGSKTGLSRSAKADFVGSGPGEAYSRALPVKKGERFLMVVDNVYKNGGGHRLTFQYHEVEAEVNALKEEKKSEKVVEEILSSDKKLAIQKNEEKTKEYQGKKDEKELLKPEKKGIPPVKSVESSEVVRLYAEPVVEQKVSKRAKKWVSLHGNIAAADGTPLAAIVTCRDKKTAELLATTTADKNGNYTISIPKIKAVGDYRCEFFADGYFFADTLFSAKNLARHAKQALSKTLQPLEVGTTFRISNITFYGESAEPLSESRYIYRNIAQIMQAYKGMKIRVEGHTNGCKGGVFSSTQLSMRRAESVKNYLQKSNVSENRVETKGWGCSKMLYPLPKNKTEAQLNRRVEIIIVAL